jgi:hypothetical protein
MEMFAEGKRVCSECGTKFVPFAKDVFKMWDQELMLEDDWLHSANWAINRVYADNLHFCSPECIETDRIKRHALEIQEAWNRLNRKYR